MSEISENLKGIAAWVMVHDETIAHIVVDGAFELDRLTARNAALVEAVKELLVVEWITQPKWAQDIYGDWRIDGETEAFCTYCGASKFRGHDSDCRAKDIFQRAARLIESDTTR